MRVTCHDAAPSQILTCTHHLVLPYTIKIAFRRASVDWMWESSSARLEVMNSISLVLMQGIRTRGK
jgi:hypothetical protein